MKQREIISLLVAIIILSLTISFRSILELNFTQVSLGVSFAIIIIAVNVTAKKLMAKSLDSNVEHNIWKFYRYGFHRQSHFKKALPFGIIIPLIVTIFTLGFIKWMTILTYETKALKRRAAKRFGHYSFTEMTEWHNALIGAAGIVAILFLILFSYFIPGLEGLPTFATYYAFFNLIPFSKLDGAQIFYGSRILWTALAIITLILTTYSFIIV